MIYLICGHIVVAVVTYLVAKSIVVYVEDSRWTIGMRRRCIIVSLVPCLNLFTLLVGIIMWVIHWTESREDEDASW